MSEAKKHVIRILSSYTRLLCTLTLGIIVVPLTIRWLGDDAFGIITFLGANIGMAGIFRQIIQNSLVRELGHAYHSDDETFARNYATACMIAIVCALLSIVSFGIVFALIPVFKIPDEFVVSARWFVVGQGLYTAVMVLLAPMLSMYLVKEKFIGYNIWYVGVRASNIISVLILGYVIAIDNPALGLALHGITWGVLAIVGMIIAAWVIVSQDHRLMFRVSGSDKDARSQVLSTFSWNTSVQVAINLHESIPQLLLNIFSGTLANAAWGIGFRFVSYIRMCTTGVQFGSDAISARLASGDNSQEARAKLQRFIAIQTKLTAMIAMPAAIAVFVFAWPIFDLWVGGPLKDYDAVMPVAVYMSRILAIAIAARSISETWMYILYGSGHIRSYAPLILAGGIIAPVSSLVLMLILPEAMVVYAPPTMFAIVFVFLHLGGLPIIAGRCLHIKPSALLLAIVRPMVAAMVGIGCALGVLALGGRLTDLGMTGALSADRGHMIEWAWMLGSMGTFAIVYAIGAFAIVIDSSERQRIMNLIRPKNKS